MNIKKNDVELSNILESIKNVLKRQGFKLKSYIYNFNEKLYYKAFYFREDSLNNNYQRLQVSLCNSGDFILQGRTPQTFRDDLRALINDEIKGHKQLDMFQEYCVA